jgi:hypothetical protein
LGLILILECTWQPQTLAKPKPTPTKFFEQQLRQYPAVGIVAICASRCNSSKLHPKGQQKSWEVFIHI